MSGRPVAIVTGGTRGIGRAIAEALAEDGFDLLLTYNTDKTSAHSFVQTLRAQHQHIECAIVGGDLSLQQNRTNVFKTLDETFQQRALRVMVHNAGQYVGSTSSNVQDLPTRTTVFGDGSLLDEEGIPDMRYVSYYQALYGEAYIDLCERALQRMDQSGGSLVGISSPGCNFTMTPRLQYSANGTGKCVMEYANRIFAMTAAKKNVNCNVVVPGITMSDAMKTVAQLRGNDPNDFQKQVVEKRVPMKRSAQPSDVANVVSFLCSAKGRYITGVSLPVDGGLHLK